MIINVTPDNGHSQGYESRTRYMLYYLHCALMHRQVISIRRFKPVFHHKCLLPIPFKNRYLFNNECGKISSRLLLFSLNIPKLLILCKENLIMGYLLYPLSMSWISLLYHPYLLLVEFEWLQRDIFPHPKHKQRIIYYKPTS